MLKHDFEQIYFGRKSIREYDPGIKISQTELEKILEEATRTPSSQNMQPWHFSVVTTPAGKEQIMPLFAYNKRQAETSSAMIFIFGDLKPNLHLPEIMQGTVESGSMSELDRDRRLEQITAYYRDLEPSIARETAVLDAGMLAMSLMLVARKYGYDTCPIGGFDKEHIADVLMLDSQRYFPVLAISLGKALDSGYDSYRLPVDSLTDWH